MEAQAQIADFGKVANEHEGDGGAAVLQEEVAEVGVPREIGGGEVEFDLGSEACEEQGVDWDRCQGWMGRGCVGGGG